MAFFEGIKMTGGYDNGPDIISSCSVNVNQGEIVSILGPNGAGKTTLMSMNSGTSATFNSWLPFTTSTTIAFSETGGVSASASSDGTPMAPVTPIPQHA